MNNTPRSSRCFAALAGAISLLLASCANEGPLTTGSSSATGLPWNSPRSWDASPSKSSGASIANERPGLGTKAGYERESTVNRTQFYRKGSTPDAVASFYYNDEDGAKTMADLLGGGTRRTGLMELAGGRLRSGLVSYGDEAYPHFDAKTRQIVMGRPGQHYQIRLENRTSHRQEIIVSVDSLNVLTGTVAGYQQRGFIVPAKGAINIDGFRVNDNRARTFEFNSVAKSKAASQGQSRNVGVVGLAVFEEDEAKATMMLRKEQFQREDASAFPVSAR